MPSSNWRCLTSWVDDSTYTGTLATMISLSSAIRRRWKDTFGHLAVVKTASAKRQNASTSRPLWTWDPFRTRGWKTRYMSRLRSSAIGRESSGGVISSTDDSHTDSVSHHIRTLFRTAASGYSSLGLLRRWPHQSPPRTVQLAVARRKGDMLGRSGCCWPGCRASQTGIQPNV
jgi:hypothetical protein